VSLGDTSEPKRFSSKRLWEAHSPAPSGASVEHVSGEGAGFGHPLGISKGKRFGLNGRLDVSAATKLLS